MGDPAQPASDEDLADRVRADPAGAGGRAAASELFDRYQGRVYLWCFRRVRDHERALDLAQDILLSAYRSVGSFEGRSRYSTWLFAIARHRCFRALRNERPSWDEGSEPDDLPGSEKAADVRLQEEEDEEAFLALVKEVLERQEQLALWLRCFEHLPVDEITRRLQIPVSTGARGILQSARRKLRAALDKRARAEGRRS
jgi:RNA polymerase sigma-70 factor (ECF subfamily)